MIECFASQPYPLWVGYKSDVCPVIGWQSAYDGYPMAPVLAWGCIVAVPRGERLEYFATRTEAQDWVDNHPSSPAPQRPERTED